MGVSDVLCHFVRAHLYTQSDRKITRDSLDAINKRFGFVVADTTKQLRKNVESVRKAFQRLSGQTRRHLISK